MRELVGGGGEVSSVVVQLSQSAARVPPVWCGWGPAFLNPSLQVTCGTTRAEVCIFKRPAPCGSKVTNAELPNLDFSTAALISSAGHPFNILFLKLSTISSLPASLLGILSLAASLCHEVDIGDDHVLADRLAHVVDGEQSNGGSREGFHLHPCLAGALHPENKRLRQKRPKGQESLRE